MRSPHVLIASDRLDRCSPLMIALNELGARATLVAPGTAAVVAAGQLSPDLVVVDGDHEDGCRTVLSLGRIRALRRTLVLTDTPTGPRIDRCLIAGAVDVLAWQGSPDWLARLIVDGVQALPPDRARSMGQRRREALGRLAASEARRPSTVTVRITALERLARGSSPGGDGLLDTLGPAQRRLLAGLRAGMSSVEMAHASGVTLSAIYRAKRRLARRLGVPTALLVETVADGRAVAHLLAAS